MLFNFNPSPTTFVRFVLIAEAASGADIYKLLDRCRSVGRFLSMSSCGLFDLADQPRIEFFVLEAPDSSYPEF
mgnify:CR=1 FL=1